MTDNKKVMARNIQKYMSEKGVNATELCRELGFKQNTFSDWVNAKTYPRIDAIEKMANYFQVSKAYLVEDNADEYLKAQIITPRIEGQAIIIPQGKPIQIESHPGVAYRKKPNHHIAKYTLKEMMMIQRYRKADKDTKRAVDKLLSYVEVKE